MLTYTARERTGQERKKERSKGESQQETWSVRPSSYMGKILNLHKPFSQCLSRSLVSHRVIAIKIVLQSEQRVVVRSTVVSQHFFLPKAPPYMGNNFLNVNSIIHLDMQHALLRP